MTYLLRRFMLVYISIAYWMTKVERRRSRNKTRIEWDEIERHSQSPSFSTKHEPFSLKDSGWGRGGRSMRPLNIWKTDLWPSGEKV